MAKLTGTNPDQVPTNADLGTMAYQDKDNVNVGSFTSNGIDDNATSTAMTLDSSGNLLVGKTSANTYNTTAGFETRPDGLTSSTRDGAISLILNRLTSDGDIAVFRKNGTTVGSIGANGGDLFIGTGDTGLRFKDDTDDIRPWNTTTNALTDGTIDIGDNIARFKDLYLSGGVYLGGTGSANKLDDYETGEFTATISCGSGTIALDVGQRKCAYTKIGKLVHIQGSLGIGAISSPSGEFRIVGAPFVMDTSLGDQAEISAASVALYEMASNITGLLNAEISMDAGVATILIRDNGGQTTSVQNIANKFDSDSIVRFSVQYMTT